MIIEIVFGGAASQTVISQEIFKGRGDLAGFTNREVATLSTFRVAGLAVFICIGVETVLWTF